MEVELDAVKYHWRGDATSIIFVATNVLSGQDTSFVETKVCLSFVATKVCLSFVATNIFLSRQNYICLVKHVFVATKHIFCRDKSMLVVCLDKSMLVVCRDKYIFVATKLYLSGQTRFCRDRTRLLSRQKYTCRDIRDKIMFVSTKVLSQQAYFCRDKRCVLSRQTRVCRDKNDTCGSSRQ